LIVTLAGIPFPAATLSVSIGVTSPSGEQIEAPEGGEVAGEALFRAADAALYRAKGVRSPSSLLRRLSRGDVARFFRWACRSEAR
jgi:hypothetical protein